MGQTLLCSVAGKGQFLDQDSHMVPHMKYCIALASCLAKDSGPPSM
jgi:hypothetical protein